jgi:hypothetical protein
MKYCVAFIVLSFLASISDRRGAAWEGGIDRCSSQGASRSSVFLNDLEAEECGDVLDAVAKVPEGSDAVHSVRFRMGEGEELLGVN